MAIYMNILTQIGVCALTQVNGPARQNNAEVACQYLLHPERNSDHDHEEKRTIRRSGNLLGLRSAPG
jgi:hypothetical protein